MGGIADRRALAPVLLALALGLAACGGASSASTGAAAPTAAPTTAATAGGVATDPGGGPSSNAPDPVGSPSSAPAPTDGAASSAPGALGKVCDLVTTDEMASALGTGTMTQSYFPGPPDTCDYRVDGTPMAALVLLDAGNGGGMIYDTMKADPDSKEIAGIGDRALFSSSTGTFLVLKGDRLVTITLTASLDDAARLEAFKRIATSAAGRL